MTSTALVRSHVLLFRGLLTALILVVTLVSSTFSSVTQKSAAKGRESGYEVVGVTIVNVYARNVAGALQRNMTIVTDGDVISDIHPATEEELNRAKRRTQATHLDDPSLLRTVDGRGLYALPGLIDIGGHLEWNSNEEAMLRVLLANGVTAILEAGNSSPQVYRLRRDSLATDFLGPRMEVCGPIITGSPAAKPGMTAVSTSWEVKEAVRARAAAGAKFVMMDAQLPPALAYDVIQEAQRHGMRVPGHLGRTNALEATAFGVNIIASLSGVPDSAVPDPETPRSWHALGFSRGWQASNAAWPQADPHQLQELIRHMVANHVCLSPTLWFQKVFTTLNEETPEKKDAIRFSFAPQSILNGWRNFATGAGDPAIYKTAWPYEKRFVKSFFDAGGCLVAGTDTPNPFVPPGFGMHLEMETLAEAGIPPLEVIKAATVYASRALGHEEDYGSIDIGNRADFVLVDGNPLEDLRNVRDIRAVFRSGRPYNPRQLVAELPEN